MNWFWIVVKVAEVVLKWYFKWADKKDSRTQGAIDTISRIDDAVIGTQNMAKQYGKVIAEQHKKINW